MKKKKNVFALIGNDGCGKSTILKELQKDEYFGDYDFIWARWKPYFLKPLYKAINKGGYEKVKTQGELNSDYSKKKSLKDKLFKNAFIRAIWLKGNIEFIIKS